MQRSNKENIHIKKLAQQNETNSTPVSAAFARSSNCEYRFHQMSGCKQSQCYLNHDTPQQSWLLIITALFFIADLFFGCFLYWARCSFMSATKSVFICAGRPLALLHTVLSSLEMKTRHNNFVSKAYSVKSLCHRIGSVRKTLMLQFLSIWLPPIHIS